MSHLQVGVEGMYVLGEARRRALHESGLALEPLVDWRADSR